MKYTKFVIAIALILASFTGFTQVKEPGDPGGTPTGEPPLGGGAPIGSGTFILLGLGTLYATYKRRVVTEKDDSPKMV